MARLLCRALAAICMASGLNCVALFPSAAMSTQAPKAEQQTAPEAQPQVLETQPLMIRTRAGKQYFFTVELADQPAEQRIGLMYRTSLGEDAGMIFTYAKPRRLGMWMKNTLIGLDMLFLDARGRVLNVHEGAVPGSLASIRSAGPGVAVVEIAEGRAKALGLSAGDMVFHCRFKNFPCDVTPPQ